jgi:hypothetical protein
MAQRRSNRDPHNYQSVVRHEHQEKPSRQSCASADTAIGRARNGFDHGAVEAYVIRKTDGIKIYDGPAGLFLEHDRW